MSAENGEMGTGKAVATMPRHETPRGFPPVPTNVAVSVVDKNQLHFLTFDL
jgi:hypothetical protein